MFHKFELKRAFRIGGLSLAGLMLAALAGCNSNSSSTRTSEGQAVSNPAPAAKQGATLGSPKNGKELFQENCTTCHGMNGQGVPRLGADLQTSKFIADSSDAQLVAFIEQGRSADDPLNKMHVAMPPKGGDPALTTQDIYDIVAFLRQIQKTNGK